MYSLYRAWLMHDAVLSTPPDLILHVGAAPRATHQFAAHRAVVAAHSGYLKALLPATAAGTVSVSVPNVSPDVFASLLTFMYTGYMDVTHENIYAVLLATHLLHMPRALDLCRSFLVHNQTRQQHTAHSHPTLVKPIPSRKMLPVLFDMGGLAQSSAGPYWPPPPPPPLRLGAQFLLPTANSPFRTVAQAADGAVPETAPPGSSDAGGDRHDETVAPAEQPTGSPLAIPSTSAACRLPSPPSSTRECLSPCLPPTLLQERNVFAKDANRSDTGRSSHREASSKENRRVQEKNELSAAKSARASAAAGSSSGSKVIIDVACCDGPVRFHRVLNDNYGLTLDELLPEKLKNLFEINDNVPHKESDRLCHEKLQMKMLKTVLVNDDAPLLAPEDARKGESCEVAAPENPPQASAHASADNEAASTPKISDLGSVASNSGMDTVYTCLYCNHAFKSHYCYQKHARRHINPVTIDLKCIADRLGGNKKTVPVCKILSSEKLPTSSDVANNGKPKDKVRREVRLLDMNVQYYPCKTCGSKFPSYYFVHKHRKLCHANEETDSVFSSDEAHSLSQAAVV